MVSSEMHADMGGVGGVVKREREYTNYQGKKKFKFPHSAKLQVSGGESQREGREREKAGDSEMERETRREQRRGGVR